jgi:alkanesulfonate monooxygenase SsuD/methylene tetrahydromethanopterin reductase-like flavin-dependent oxidoreductase (luciferase family)
MTALKFGVMIFPDSTISDLISRMRHAEALGFDQLFLPDHTGDLRGLAGPWHDTWILLAVAATITHRIRIGTLVANPILRPPTATAKQAMTIDHLSNGRLDLGLGAGIFAFDHQATGTPAWPARERMQRFDEYTQIVDGICAVPEHRSASTADGYGHTTCQPRRDLSKTPPTYRGRRPIPDDPAGRSRTRRGLEYPRPTERGT